MRTPGATYDTIGRSYACHRRPDPWIADALGSARTILNVGTETGFYEPPNRALIAVELSAVMIAQRPPSGPPVVVVMVTAGDLPFADRSFDAAMAILTLHHWPDPASGLAEMRRVADRQVVPTFDPAMLNRFWLLTDYVPAAAELEAARPCR